MTIAKTILRRWLPLALLATAFCGLVYVAVQQSLRLGANDPQIQLAEDTADALARGGAVASLVPASQVDIARSLAPFVVVFNDKGEALASSGLLHGRPPALPAGVLDYARQHGQDRVTWQPEPGVRVASVVVAYGGTSSGFVMAGRSLREVEKRIDQVGQIAGAAWLATLVASLALVALGELVLGRRAARQPAGL